MSRAEYDALLDRMQHMENELTFLRVRPYHHLFDAWFFLLTRVSLTG
jgi:hypothetical protein